MSKHSMEFDANDATAAKGVMHEESFTLKQWELLAGGPLIASTTNIVGFKATMTNDMAMVWDAGADTGDVVSLDWTTDSFFRGIGGDEEYPSHDEGPILQLLVLARKLDTTGSAADNTDLALTADMYWYHSDADEAIGARTGDTALNHLTTPASVVMDVLAGAATEEAYHWYVLDLGARLEAETKVLKPDSSVRINLGPDQAVGTALNIEVLRTRLRYRRHTGIQPRTRQV